MTNPLLEEWPEHGLPDFDAISPEHYREAFEAAFAEHEREIQAIVDQHESVSFANTLDELERSGKLLDRVAAVFFNLTSSMSSEEMQEIELEISPRYTAHYQAIFSNQALYERVRAVRAGDETLTSEQLRLLEETERHFIRAGAALDSEERERVAAIDRELATLEARFAQNVLKDTNEFELVLEEGDDLAGLPDFVLQAAASEARERGHEGRYLFTISRSSITPFLQYAARRDLRERIYAEYTRAGHAHPERDNHELIRRIVSLRGDRAAIMGYESHAAYKLDDCMAGTPEAVRDLLNRIWAPARERVREEAEDLQRRAQEEGENFRIAPWDWWYFTEKVRREKFSLDEEEVKPYFRLEAVRDGAFEVARRLYGIRFEATTEVPVYHPDVQSYWVLEADGSRIGLFLVDYFMRRNKRGGAWMSNFRGQANLDGPQYPVVVNCCNFPKSDPCLLGMDEVRTLFHEFGHGLHGLLSKVTYPSLSGTNVKQDFVELPSQIMEHWAMEPEVLREYARHHESGEPIPDDLIERLRKAEKFNQGFATTEYLAASYLDLAWHAGGVDEGVDVEAFERQALDEIGLVEEVDPRYKSSYFQHIFAGSSYSAGYYSYIWAEVLDADGFEAFKENGLFDPATAGAFRRNVLERGGTMDPMVLYRAFRGRDPEVAPLLANRGLATGEES